MMQENIIEVPAHIQEKLEKIKEVRKEVAEHYFKTGEIKKEALARLHVLLKQTADAVFEEFPVLFMQRETYILPAPTSEAELRFMEREGFQLIIPAKLEGKSLEELLAIQKENLLKYIPLSHLFAVDAEFMVFLEAHFEAQKAKRAEQGNENEKSFIEKQLEVQAGIEVKKDEFVETQESGELVSENIAKRKKRKASEL